MKSGAVKTHFYLRTHLKHFMDIQSLDIEEAFHLAERNGFFPIQILSSSLTLLQHK